MPVLERGGVGRGIIGRGMEKIMTNDNDTTFQELAEAVQEIERLKASNEFKAEAVRQQAGRCLELMRERDELAAANHELFDELRRHVDGCGCRLEARFSSTAANALRVMLAPTVACFKLCQAYADVNGDRALNDELTKELSRIKSLMEGKV